MSVRLELYLRVSQRLRERLAAAKKDYEAAKAAKDIDQMGQSMARCEAILEAMNILLEELEKEP